jgi:hypothetical protein
MNIYTRLLILIAFIKLINAQNPNPKEAYTNQIVLESPDFIYLYWKHDSSDITFEIHYKNTSRWILFGLSTESYSDVIVGWLNNDGTGHFSDRNVNNLNVLAQDSHQDWLIQDAYLQNNYQVLKFKRSIKICDTNFNEDLDVQPGSQNKLIYIYGSSADDISGNLGDYNPSSLKTLDSFKLLQSNGPFNCQIKQSTPIFTSTPTGYYSNYVDLVNGIYRFYWNLSSSDLIGEIHVKTNGWVGFGLSPNGGMHGSDVIIGWINDNDGSVNFTVYLSRYLYF